MFSSTCLLQISSLLLFSYSVVAHPRVSGYLISDLIARLQQIQQSGTCRSAGHVNGCCDSGPNPATACRVQTVGGYCYCDIHCYRYNDCCSDMHEINCLLPTTPPPTTPPPPTCASGGHTGCCMRGPGSSCEVTNAGMTCYCDQGCHERDECCSDIGNTCPAPTTPPPTTTPPPPTCISGGHTGCCTRTPGNSCSVSNDGMSCYCDQGCHERDECCSDIGNTCPAPSPTTTPLPPTCMSGGYTGCCIRGPDNSCSVTNAGTTCYCDQGCHERGECCSDIETIGCYAHNRCPNNNLNTSCCDRSNDVACRVTLSNSASCWCDSRCKTSNNDCCNDFIQFCSPSTPTSSTANLRLHQLIRQLKMKLARQMTHVRPLEWSSNERALQQYERPQEFRPNYEDSLSQQYEIPRGFRPSYPNLSNGNNDERAAALWRQYNVARIQNYQLSRKLQELQQRIQSKERMASLFRRYGAGQAAEMYAADED